MGGRGSYNYSTGSIPIENRFFEQIGMLDGIKVLRHKTNAGKSTPVMSNTANTAYAVFSKKENKITSLYFYKNHTLYRSVDIEDNGHAHAHHWEYNPKTGIITRKRHDSSNIFPLTSKETNLVNNARKWKE